LGPGLQRTVPRCPPTGAVRVYHGASQFTHVRAGSICRAPDSVVVSLSNTRRTVRLLFGFPCAKGLSSGRGKLMPTLTHRCMVCLLAGVILFASLGIAPVWVPPAYQSPDPRISDESFACKDHQCGCQNAATCRAHCCCHRPVAAASPQHAARSCPAHGKAEAPSPVASITASGAGSPRLVIQSTECAGNDPFWLLKSLCWVLQFEPPTIHLLTKQGSLCTQVTALCDQINLSSEPPPPRAC